MWHTTGCGIAPGTTLRHSLHAVFSVDVNFNVEACDPTELNRATIQLYNYITFEPAMSCNVQFAALGDN